MSDNSQIVKSVMESASIQFILEWAIMPLAIVVIWMVRKMGFIDSQVQVMSAESESRIKQGEVARIELMDAINTHHQTVTNRLISIEEHLRNGKK